MTCSQCKHYDPAKQTCTWRPAPPFPMWLRVKWGGDFNPWISPSTDADKCEVKEKTEC